MHQFYDDETVQRNYPIFRFRSLFAELLQKKAPTQQPTLELSTEIINIFLQAADDDNVSNVVMYLVKVSHYQSLLPDGFQITIHPSAPRQRNISTSRDGFYVS